jgi:hypothetical protein
MNFSEIFDRLQRDKFYGSLELKFEAGRVVLVRKTETLKPEGNLSEQPRKQCAGPSSPMRLVTR